MVGFEPTTSWSRTKRADQAALHPEVIEKMVICESHPVKI